MLRERGHRARPEREEEVETGAGQIHERIADAHVLPVDHRDDLVAGPQDVAGPEVAVEQRYVRGLRRGPVRAQRLADVGFPDGRIELGGRIDEMLGNPFGSTR